MKDGMNFVQVLSRCCQASFRSAPHRRLTDLRPTTTTPTASIGCSHRQRSSQSARGSRVMPTKRLFSDWNKEELEETFSLTRVFQHPLLDVWFAQAERCELTAFEQELVTNLRQLIFENIDAWNEIELAEYFIGPILTCVNFNTPAFKIFSERHLVGLVGDYELSGEPDAVIAKGHYSPKIPYFCFHEYKKENEPKGDPAAQALAAMLVAQSINLQPHPMYGIYVVGKLWHFMVLQEDEYCISKSFAADDEEIFDIFKILKALKQQDASTGA